MFSDMANNDNITMDDNNGLPSVSTNETGTVQTKDNFWLNNPTILFRKDTYYQIIPSPQMTYNEKLNAMTRFFIFLAILLLIFCGYTEHLYIPIIGIVAIVIIYIVNKKNNKTELLSNQEEDNTIENNNNQVPETNDSFTNLTSSNLIINSGYYLPPSKDLNPDETIDIDVILNNSKRQFYTMSSAIDPDDKTTFAKFLYDHPETCKENQSACLKYEDVRFSR